MRKKAESFVEFKKNYPSEQKLCLLKRLEEVTSFEEYFRYKYPTANRFGIEGLESLQVGLKSIIDVAIDSNMDEIVIGMSHRGRLSVLHHTAGKPFWKIIREFTGKNLKKDFDG
jgi:2-oxoglutarate dehydrogenase E1 component